MHTISRRGYLVSAEGDELDSSACRVLFDSQRSSRSYSPAAAAATIRQETTARIHRPTPVVTAASPTTTAPQTTAVIQTETGAIPTETAASLETAARSATAAIRSINRSPSSATEWAAWSSSAKQIPAPAK